MGPAGGSDGAPGVTADDARDRAAVEAVLNGYAAAVDQRRWADVAGLFGDDAVADFGPPATVAGGGRPFALPVLREDTRVTRVLARTVEGVLAR